MGWWQGKIEEAKRTARRWIRRCPWCGAKLVFPKRYMPTNIMLTSSLQCFCPNGHYAEEFSLYGYINTHENNGEVMPGFEDFKRKYDA